MSYVGRCGKRIPLASFVSGSVPCTMYAGHSGPCQCVVPRETPAHIVFDEASTIPPDVWFVHRDPRVVWLDKYRKK